MAEFTQALPFIISHEGTTLYEDKETGERSRYGITSTLLKLINFVEKDPNNLTIPQVAEIYSNVFWGPNLFAQIISQPVANKVMDMTINMKFSWGVRLLQAALNMCGAQCVIDGVMGPHTIITVNQLTSITGGEDKLLSELVLQSVSYYKRNAVGPLAKDLPGWLTRAEDIGVNEDKSAFNTLRDGSDDMVVRG